MKGNSHRKLYIPDYFGWHYYCFGARRRQRQFDKQMGKKAARKERKESVKGEDGEYERNRHRYDDAEKLF